MGRLVAFVARLRQDGMSPSPWGVGLDEETAIAIDSTGMGTVLGYGTAYIIHSPNAPQVCKDATPLTFFPIKAVRLQANNNNGDKWNFATMTIAQGGVSYGFNVDKGVVVGEKYGPLLESGQNMTENLTTPSVLRIER